MTQRLSPQRRPLKTRRNPNQSPDGKWLVRYDDKSIVIESRSTDPSNLIMNG